jgi:diguanylate cyclase (GGDEF)-like protein
MFNYLLIALSLLTCLIAIFTQNEFWSNIFLPLNSFTAGAILLSCYLKHDLRKLDFLLYSIACFAWGIGDSLWVVWELALKNPATSSVLNSIYFTTNCLFVMALFLFLMREYTKWNNVQLYIDALVIGFMNLMLIWMILLHKDTSVIIHMLNSGMTSIISIILDVVTAIGVLSFLFSVRSGKISRFLKIIDLGLLLFCFSDIVYFYADLNGVYLPNSLFDFAYALSLQLIALGALCRVNTYCGATVTLSDITNIGTIKRWRFLFLYPLIAIILELFDFIDVNVTATDIILFCFLIFFYRASCKYVQISIENEHLLETANRANELLENRVAEQVAELTFLINQDTLTTLFNRRYFLSCVDESIASLGSNEILALLLIDVDRFKTINDDFGHDDGDKVLIDLSYRMTEWNHYGAILSRLGGDEFAILLIGKYTRRDIEDYCSEIMACFNEPICVGNNTLSLTISVGIALHAPDACDSKMLMKHADISMYRAKSQGYNKYQFYDPLFSEDINRNRELENMLKQSDVEKDFELFFQPQFSLPDKSLIGAEALIRWNHPEHGYIPPNIFIPVAEEIDQISKIGQWVMQETIRQAMIWNQRYPIGLKVGFNISTKQFDDDEFVDLLSSLILDTGVNTAWLDAEITESVMIIDGYKVNEIFQVLNKLGLSVSIDDFGAGYSSLSYLTVFDFDRIKIDKSLIDQVSHNNIGGIHVVKAAISMAKAVGIKTIAEGVETQEELDLLTELGCDEVQGYLLGRPVPADVFEDRFLSLVTSG